MALDLAQVLEKTRKLKRKLCAPPYNFDTDFVFSGDFLDPDHILRLREKVLEARDVPGVSLCLLEIDHVVDALKAGPERPSDVELCRRYVTKEIDSRTVRHITGWSPVELYNKCVEYGLEAPSFSD
jgi:hypothetical protein